MQHVLLAGATGSVVCPGNIHQLGKERTGFRYDFKRSVLVIKLQKVLAYIKNDLAGIKFCSGCGRGCSPFTLALPVVQCFASRERLLYTEPQLCGGLFVDMEIIGRQVIDAGI